MLNLLIAMFTYSFDRVQKNTEGDMDKWNKMRYDNIREYYNKNIIHPPFSIFEPFYLLGKKIFCSRRNNDVDSEQGVLKGVGLEKQTGSLFFKRPMRLLPGTNLMNWNHMNENIDLQNIRKQQMDIEAIEHAALAQYVKCHNTNGLFTGKNSYSVTGSGHDRTGNEKELKQIKEQNSKFHDKINKLNRSVNNLSKGLDKRQRKMSGFKKNTQLEEKAEKLKNLKEKLASPRVGSGAEQSSGSKKKSLLSKFNIDEAKMTRKPSSDAMPISTRDVKSAPLLKSLTSTTNLAMPPLPPGSREKQTELGSTDDDALPPLPPASPEKLTELGWTDDDIIFGAEEVYGTNLDDDDNLKLCFYKYTLY